MIIINVCIHSNNKVCRYNNEMNMMQISINRQVLSTTAKAAKLSIYPSIYLSIYLNVYLSIYLSIYLCKYIYIYIYHILYVYTHIHEWSFRRLRRRRRGPHSKNNCY